MPRSKGLIYYVSAEDEASTAQRANAERIFRQLSDETAAQLGTRVRWLQIDGHCTPAQVATKIEGDAHGREIDIVIVDTGPALFNGDDENSNPELQAFANECRRLARLPGSPCTVVLWHPTKSAAADKLLPLDASHLNNKSSS